MDTSSLLDILHRPGQPTTGQAPNAAPQKGASNGIKAILEGVEELWDNSQYTEEFSLDNYVQKLA